MLKAAGVIAILAAGVSLGATIVGYTPNPPFTNPGPNGAPEGFVVEVFNQAASRAGIALEWKLVESTHLPLWERDPSVRIWPAGVASERRRRHFYITKPWWRTELIVVTRPGIDALKDLDGKRLAATADLESSLRSRLSGSSVELSETHTASAISFCHAFVDAFVTDRVILDRILVDRPPECQGVRFHLLALPGATLDLSVLAVPADRDTAERLRREIQSMESRGLVSEIALKYPAISAASARFMTLMMRNEHRSDLLRLALILVSLLLAVAAVLLFRTYREVAERKRKEQELRETNSDLKQFSYAASHDLLEPLRNMVLYSEVLERKYGDRLDSDGRRFLSVIQQGGQRMQRLLDNLRDYTELTREPGPSEEVDTRQIVEQALTALSTRIDETSAQVTCGELPKVRFDDSRLLQVFQNLISNALKYRGDGAPRVHITARRQDSDWVFCVEDCGVGIPPEYHVKIFDAFKRLHSSDISGAGLGLAICKRIVERAGGRIWVESHKGEGARFYFTIRAQSAVRQSAATSSG